MTMPFPKNKITKLEPIPEVDLGGRPEYEPTQAERKVVWMAAAIGIPQDRIARHLNGGKGICKMTLQKHFRKELNDGMWEADMEVVGTLWDTIRHCKDPKIKQRAIELWMERRMPEYFGTKMVQSNEPSKLVITVEGGLPKMEHVNGNGIDISHANGEDSDSSSDAAPRTD